MKATQTEKRIVITPNKTLGIESYDIGNDYPQRMQDIINASGTGTLCTNMLSTFIYGQGFEDENVSELKVNSKRLTSNKLLSKVSKSISKFNGFAIHVNYDANFNKTSFSYVPFQDVRFTTEENKNNPKKLAVYDDWEKQKSRKIKDEEIDYFNYYNPDPKEIQKQVDLAGGWHLYKGQLMYWSIDGLEYPRCPLDSVIEDVQTDYSAKIFKNNNINTNFMASHFLKVKQFEDEEQLENLTNTISNFQGAANSSRVTIIELENEDDMFELEKVDIQDMGDLYDFTESSARDNIIRASLIPHVLLVSTAGSLGQSSESVEAYARFNGVTNFYRMEIAAVFKELFNDSIFGKFENCDILQSEAKTANVRDTQEGRSKILEIIINNEISNEAKISILTELYGISQEVAEKLTIKKDV